MGRGRKLIKLLTAAGLGICMLPGTVLADCDVEQISIQMPKIRLSSSWVFAGISSGRASDVGKLVWPEL